MLDRCLQVARSQLGSICRVILDLGSVSHKWQEELEKKPEPCWVWALLGLSCDTFDTHGVFCLRGSEQQLSISSDKHGLEKAKLQTGPNVVKRCFRSGPHNLFLTLRRGSIISQANRARQAPNVCVSRTCLAEEDLPRTFSTAFADSPGPQRLTVRPDLVDDSWPSSARWHRRSVARLVLRCPL